MSLPDNILVTLQEINGNSCGSITQNIVKRAGTNPTAYWSVGQSGQMAYCEIVPVTDGNGDVIDYRLLAVYVDPNSSCNGSHTFHLSAGSVTPPPDADPLGNYCKGSSDNTDCSDGKASAEDND